MEMFTFASAVWFVDIMFIKTFKPSIREKLVAKREFNNTMDKHAVKVVKGGRLFASQVLLNSVVFSYT